MYRTHTCGELRIKDKGTNAILSGWIQKSRDLGGMTFIDLRDRYGITQLVFNMDSDRVLCEHARKLGREFVIQVRGKVEERSNKNSKIPTGDIEIQVEEIAVLSTSKNPPFSVCTLIGRLGSRRPRSATDQFLEVFGIPSPVHRDP